MSLSTVDITGNIADQLGSDFDTRRTKITVRTNVPSDTVIDTVGNAIRLGSGRVTLNSDGSFTAAVWVPGTGSNPASWQTWIDIDYPDVATRARKVRSFGPFTITAAADLADLVEEQEVPAEYLTTVTTLLDGYVTEAEAARDAAVDISNIDTSDDVVSALVAGTAGAGPLTRAALSASFAQVFTPEAFGAAGDGTTDDHAAIQAAITAAVTAGGGTVYLSAKTYRCDGQLVVPTDGATPPRMGNIRIIGTGFHSSGQDGATTPTEGSILDLRYNADPGQAKILSTGFGSLEMTGLTLTDNTTGAGNSPFVKVTNTTLHAHSMAVIGSPDKFREFCDQDAFILGGTNTPSAPDYDTTDNGPFQGYGTVIEGVYFGRIRRGVLGQTYANAIVIKNNNWWNTCGSDDAVDGCAVEFIGDVASEASGNIIIGNLIEMPGYVYGMQFERSYQNTIVGNGGYDPEPTRSIALIHFKSTALWSTVLGTFTNLGLSPIVDDSGNNFWLPSDDNEMGNVPNPITFRRSTFYEQLMSFIGIEANVRWLDNDETAIAQFSNYGRQWSNVNPLTEGGDLTIDTGQGGSYLNAKVARLRTRRYDTNAPAIGLGVEQPTDASLTNGEAVLYWNATTGVMEFRGKKADGTVVQGTITHT